MKTLIAAAMLLALTTPAHAASKGEWFLILDAWFCSTKSCADGGPPYEDFVTKETFATRKQCLAEGRRIARGHQLALEGRYLTKPRHVTEDRSGLTEIYNANGEGAGLTIAGFHPRCEWHH